MQFHADGCHSKVKTCHMSAAGLHLGLFPCVCALNSMRACLGTCDCVIFGLSDCPQEAFLASSLHFFMQTFTRRPLHYMCSCLLWGVFLSFWGTLSSFPACLQHGRTCAQRSRCSVCIGVARSDGSWPNFVGEQGFACPDAVFSDCIHWGFICCH